MFNFKKKKKNKDENVGHRHFFTPEPSSRMDKVLSSSPTHPGVCADTDLPWMKTLWQFGRQRALSRGKTRANQDDINALIAHAEAMAEAHTPLPWDPLNNPHDAQVIKKLTRLETELEYFKAKLTEQIIELEEAEREYANIRK